MLLVGFGAMLVFYEDAADYAGLDYHLHHGTLPFGFLAVLIASELWSGMFLMPRLVVMGAPSRIRTYAHGSGGRCSLP